MGEDWFQIVRGDEVLKYLPISTVASGIRAPGPSSLEELELQYHCSLAGEGDPSSVFCCSA